MALSTQRIFEIFWRFLLLGCMSFGGPAAHIGYFREAFVERLKWLDDVTYASLIALSQFLPGPGSSQVGFAIGLHRGGVLGGLAAFIGFTFPSMVILITLSMTSQDALADGALAQVIHGLKLFAVVIVAHATLKMFRSFCGTWVKVVFCGVTAAIVLMSSSLQIQLLVLALAAIAGSILIPSGETTERAEGRVRWLPLLLFAGILLGCFAVTFQSAFADLFSRFYQSGSLVFGGGHVVLPLLQATVGDHMPPDRFLFGYAAAQAIPGPMFAVSGFLGAELMSMSPIAGGVTAVAGIFLPGFLLVLGLEGVWRRLINTPRVAGAAAGINAAVVGLLMSALYRPVFSSAVHSWQELLCVVVGFFILLKFRPPILVMVIVFAAIGFVL